MCARSSLEDRALREAQKAFRASGPDRDFGFLRRLSPNGRGVLIGSVVFGLFGAFMFPWMIWSQGRVEDMAHWTATDATVLSTDTAYSYQRYGGSGYKHEISFSYVVGDREYIGDRVSYGDAPPKWPSRAQAVRNLPAAGSSIQIRYNPKDPSDSVIYVLTTSPGMFRYMLWLVGVVGALGGALLLISVAGVIKERRTSRPSQRVSALRADTRWLSLND